jgi:TRAP-type C4-dicarboxylate transport system substrate-binding protein
MELSFASQNNEQSWGHVKCMEPWARKVEEEAKNKIKIRIYPSNTLSAGKDNWSAAKSGIADIAWCWHGYWPNMTPLNDVMSLPALPFKTAEKGSEIYWRLYEQFPEIQNELKDNRVLLLYTSPPYLLITTRKQVKTLEDLKGMKVRVAGGPPTDQMKALGGVPMLIPMPDVYMAMQKGVIDGMGAPWEAIHGFRLYEIVKYYTIVPLSAVYFSMSMNKAKFESLPKDIQEAIKSAGGLEAAKFWGKNWFDTAEEGVAELIKKGNYQMTKYTVPPNELAEWSKVAGEPRWKEWVKRMESKGRPDAQQVLDAALQLLKQ